MNLSANSMLEGKYSYEKMHEIYGKAGFECNDYSLERLKNDEDVLNSESFRTEAENIRKSAERNGLTVNQIHAPFSWSNKLWLDESSCEETIFPRIVRSLEISGIFGAKVAVVHPLHHFTYPGHEEEIFEVNMKYYRRLIQIGRASCRERV